MAKPSFVYVSYIVTTPEKLWQALTSPEFTRQYWFGREVKSDWRVGSPVTYRYDEGRKLDIEGKVLECDPPRRLSYTFTSHSGGGGHAERPSRVTFELQPAGATVKLTMTHDEFDAGSKVLAGVSNGWPAILSSLKSVLESGRPIVFGDVRC